MFNKVIIILVSVFLTISWWVKPALAAAFDYDLSIGPNDISFSNDVLIAGTTVRIHATVHNVGNKDILGYVSFLQGMELLGNSQPISVLPGKGDDVFVDFTVPESSFNIQAKIQGTEPADQNLANNETQSKLIYPEHDTDSDGIIDSQDTDDDNDGLIDSQEFDDQCPYRLKADSDNDGVKDASDAFPCDAKETKDTDHDGLGDNADPDDDNDGWSDSEELAKGTDPQRADTDGDGVLDPQDAYPLDSSKSQVERNIFQPPVANNLKKENELTTTSQLLPSTNQELESITQQVKEVLESDKEIHREGMASTTDQDKAVVEKLGGTKISFFRWNNWLLWLFVLLAAVIVVIIFFLREWYKNKFTESIDLPKRRSSKKSIIKIKQIAEPPANGIYKASSHLIDLKKIVKKK